jgi:macrolide transport system ATP-binding/permease protein
VGQSILVNNVRFTVAGVSPREFFGADPDAAPDIYLPMHSSLLLNPPGPLNRMYLDPGYDWVITMARLRPGVTVGQAQSALAGKFLAWEKEGRTKVNPDDLPTLIVSKGGGGLDSLRRRYSKPLYVLLTLVGLILLLACANIANLLLARAAARRREIAVRLSIGAGRLRVIRQLLTESLMLALPGGLLGVAIAIAGMRSLTLLLANGKENFTLHAQLNWHVLAVTAGLSLVTGMLFGLAPALQATRVDLVPALKTARIGARTGGRISLSRLLVVSQIAIAMLILVAAGLFVRTLSNLESIQLGFNRVKMLTFHLNARQAGHGDPEIISFFSDLRARFGAVPGVRAATLSNMPAIGGGRWGEMVSVGGGKPKGSLIMAVGPGYFGTMEIPLVAGREIDERDRPASPRVAVVNEEFVKENMPGENPIGRHFSIPTAECERCDVMIAGVVKDVLYGEITKETGPIAYLAFTQSPLGPVDRMVFELRTAGDPTGYVRAVREVVHQADSRLPVTEIKSEATAIDETIGQEITFARLCTAFAILALIIACVGLYGTMSYNVARRTSEIGIRMALGAQRARVVRMVLREVLVLSVAGLAISIPTAFAAGKLIESFLYGMKSGDPAALTVAVSILLIAAILAGYLPARSASRIDPMTALRNE